MGKKSLLANDSINSLQTMVSHTKFHVLSRGIKKNSLKLQEVSQIERFLMWDKGGTSVDIIVTLKKKNYFSSWSPPIFMIFVMAMLIRLG